MAPNAAAPDLDAPVTGVTREVIFTARHFERVRRLIHQHAGISLADSKQDMVYSRLIRRLRACELDSFDRYLEGLEDPAHPEHGPFVNALTTNLTAFFREAHHFQRLRQHLLRPGAPARQLIWCAAASTGEEPYSLAITACEAFNSLNPPVRIIATDIDTDALSTASAGRYPLSRLAPLSVEQRQRFALKGRGRHEGMAQIRPELQRLIRFEQWNLLRPQPPPFRGADAVFCRNVMIYFDKPTQLQVLETLHAVMRPDGLMFAGHSESFFHAQHLFRNLGQTVYAPVTGSGR
ncbi:chemotaxis protein CheR [Flagellatimonas centrodinii]|uniref:CheR family methyltransferase n=1 Tax=Flagellatimonas centrodinii TaxID=2806210 RepID=UPI001FEDA810|nr:CheR family methyltransferase [Flagellatimonas centrodinii]ULQ45681.1 chemotaxis protein CheR [Flagellatimonas centrodinii]